MSEPEWLDLNVVLDFHAEQLALFGGADGFRDDGFLNPRWPPDQQIAYGEADLPALAAAYAFGIARNHPFVDGNKRTALADGRFLRRERHRLRCAEKQATAMIFRSPQAK